MAFPKDFTTLIRECGLRSDCESCYWLAGTACPKHDAPQSAPVDRDGVCKDWIDAETRKSIDGKKRLCLLCGKVKRSKDVRISGCESCLGVRVGKHTGTRGKGREDGEICPKCHKPGEYQKGQYVCMPCQRKVTEQCRIRLHEQGLNQKGLPYQKEWARDRALQRVARYKEKVA
jgi:hypothetical protein